MRGRGVVRLLNGFERAASVASPVRVSQSGGEDEICVFRSIALFFDTCLPSSCLMSCVDLYEK